MRQIDELTEQIIGAAIAVHRALGPGLLESAYESCLDYELGDRGSSVERQLELPVVYRGITLDCGYRIDLWVERQVILEIKSVEKLASIHEAQLLSYMRLSGCRVGLLFNFNVRLLTQGMKRLVLNLQE